MYTNDFLEHSGTPQEYDYDPNGSGRYRQGSGGNPYQHASDFKTRYNKLHSEGLSDEEIRKVMDMKSEEFRARKALEKAYKQASEYWQVHNILEKHPGTANTTIAKMVGISEGQVRQIKKKQEAIKQDSILATMDTIRKVVDKKGIVDVSKGTETSAGLNNISSDKLKKAVTNLSYEGYNVCNIEVRQVQDYKKSTTTTVIAKPKYDKSYINAHKEKIQPFEDYMTIDNGDTWYQMKYPTSVDRKRIKVRYAEEGGAAKDGTIEIRRGVPDLDLAGKQYAQVRIAVDDKMYMKGMAFLSDEVPKGYDIIYNSNKKKGSSDDDVFKEFKTLKDGSVDKDNPFGTLLYQDKSIAQRNYIDPKTGEEKLSPVNIVKPEGEWSTYKKNLPSQFLAKQNTQLIKSQINLAMEDKLNQYEDIQKIKNPAIRQKLLEDFGDGCDKSAYELRGAALPRQATKVILPVLSLKNNEIYAPQYDQGEEVCLIRYPTGGLFEIPRLKVNNHNEEGKKVVTPSSPDAVGLNPVVATQLSGADFDGDTVVVLPTKNHKIINKAPYQELLDFDTKSWKAPVVGKDKNGKDIYGCKLMTTDDERNKQMGICSNLITDMTLSGGASDDELIRAVKYSMVVIDAKKHKLDYQQAREYYDIGSLHAKYQGKASGGASTIISRAKGEAHVPDYEDYRIDPKTGKRQKMLTNKKKYNKKGEKELVTKKITKMESVENAEEIMSDRRYNKEKDKWEKIPNVTPNEKEIIYATYANNLKSLGNEARKKSILANKEIKYDKALSIEYADEIKSISGKLKEQRKYAPRERQAQRQASYIVRAKIEQNGGWDSVDKDDRAKIAQQALAAQRAKYDSKRQSITLTPREWEAVEKGACKKTLIVDLMKNIDSDYLKEHVMPKSNTSIPANKLSRMRNMLKNGYTIKEVADQLNVSIYAVEQAKNI